MYGIPDSVTLGLILGMIIAAIYVWNRNLSVLAILGIYTIALCGATFANEADLTGPYETVTYIIALAVASLVVIMVLKTLRE